MSQHASQTTKREMIDDPESPWNKASEDEPLFVIRAHDILGPLAVRGWIMLLIAAYFRRDRPVPYEKLQAAEAVAEAMEQWGVGRSKLPD